MKYGKKFMCLTGSNIEKPLVSIILPVYNGEKFLAQSIKSCLTQSYKNLELLIVNDFSTDNSLKIAQVFAQKDKRVKIISNEENLNLPASLNIGHNAAKGEFLTWTSDDNVYEPNALEIMVFELEKNRNEIVHANFKIVEENGNTRLNFIFSQHAHLLFGNTVGGCFLYKKEVYERNGGYDEKLHTVEDYDFWLQASLHSKFHHIPKILYNYRSHSESLSSNLKKSPASRMEFNQKLQASYLKFFHSFEFLDQQKYARLFVKLHQHQKLNIYFFLKEYRHFIDKMNLLGKKVPGFNFDRFQTNIDLRIRYNCQNFKKNQNLKTLTILLNTRPSILYKYDRRRSLQIILKCLKF